MHPKKTHHTGVVVSSDNHEDVHVTPDETSKRPPGTPPKGWVKTQFYFPEKFLADWESQKAQLPSRAHKLMCTGAMALYVGLPPSVKQELFAWAHRNELDPAKMDPQEAVGLVMMGLKRAMDATPKSIEPLSEQDRERVQRVFDIVHPTRQRDGFTEQVIRTFVIRAEDDRAKKARKGGAA